MTEQTKSVYEALRLKAEWQGHTGKEIDHFVYGYLQTFVDHLAGAIMADNTEGAKARIKMILDDATVRT